VILNFDKEITAILDLVGFEANAATRLMIAMQLTQVLDRGMTIEQERCIRIVQKLSMNAMDVVREIRKPQR